MSLKNINNKLIDVVKQMRTLSDQDLEKCLINRAVLDRVLLMRKNKKTDFELLETLSFRDLVFLQSKLYEKEYLN